MIIIITGGTSGLGKATVERLASQDSNQIFFTYRLKKEVADALENKYSNVKGIQCDFCEENSLYKFIDKIDEISPDVLINNAYSGNTLGNYFYRTPIEEFEQAFKTNIIPLVRITQQAIRVFRKKKAGKIVTVLTSALVGTPPIGYSVYLATKAYIKQLAVSWSKEYITLGITSNMVSPDFMQTDLTKNLNETMVNQIIESNVLKRSLQPDEVAEVIMDLVNAPKYVNGVDIPINLGVNLK